MDLYTKELFVDGCINNLESKDGKTIMFCHKYFDLCCVMCFKVDEDYINLQVGPPIFPFFNTITPLYNKNIHHNKIKEGFEDMYDYLNNIKNPKAEDDIQDYNYDNRSDTELIEKHNQLEQLWGVCRTYETAKIRIELSKRGLIDDLWY
jgi:hypothetical protein